MIDLPTLILFSATVLLLAVTPGPDMIYIATRSLSQGRKAGIVSVLGVHTGVLVHTLAAALGLSALLASSVVAFSVVKYLGASYLVYLGVRTMLLERESFDIEIAERDSLMQVYYQGIVTNVLNPKAILFFLAFLPQFINPSGGAANLQIVFLGVLFVVVSFPVDAAVGLLGGALGAWLERRDGVQRFGKWVTGLVFIALGLEAALTGSRKR